MQVGGQRHAPAALTPGKTRYPFYRKLGGPQGRSVQVLKNLAPTGIRSPDPLARNAAYVKLNSAGKPAIVAYPRYGCYSC